VAVEICIVNLIWICVGILTKQPCQNRSTKSIPSFHEFGHTMAYIQSVHIDQKKSMGQVSYTKPHKNPTK